MSQTGESGLKYVPTDPVSNEKSATPVIVASENCVVAVRRVLPTRVPPTSSYKPSSHDVGACPGGVFSVRRTKRVWPSDDGVKRAARIVQEVSLDPNGTDSL